ncbi:hypothetical protein R1flu_002604 [Riccia fluitans]|uniref:Uncharacterized protein n=1 Tax=Riccia fluitans TaxID=41844 RepID=A0ABD1YAE9_9MARC
MASRRTKWEEVWAQVADPIPWLTAMERKLYPCSYIKKEAYLGMVSLEQGDANLQLHTQGILILTTSSTKALNADISEAIGWEENAPPGFKICIKELSGNGIHTVKGYFVTSYKAHSLLLKESLGNHLRTYTFGVVCK